MTAEENHPVVSGSQLATSAFAILCVAWLLASLAEWLLGDLLFSSAIPPLKAFWVCVPLIATVLAIRRIAQRRYRWAAVWLLIPAAAVGLALGTTTNVGDLVKFHWNKASYDRAVAAARVGRCSADSRDRSYSSADGIECDPITVVFEWGGIGSVWFGIVYDEGDEIIKPAPERSPQWKNRTIGRVLSCSGSNRALGGHYYRAGGSYTGGKDDCR
jgi:hypothetical protein